MTESSITVSSSRLLVIIISGVVVSFLLSTAFTQYRSTAIEHRVVDLVADALPGVVHLSNARTHLHNLLDMVSQYKGELSDDSNLLTETALAEKGDMEGALQSYLLLPISSTEREMAQAVNEQEVTFATAVSRYLNAIKEGKNAKNIRKEIDNLRIEGGQLDRAIARIFDFDVTDAIRAGFEIASIRSQSMYLAILLDVLSVALAVLATVIAIRVKNAAVKDMASLTFELEIFASRVAHDLKNPLGSILMACDLMKQEYPEEELTKRVSLTAKRMNEIINGLFEFARSGAQIKSGEKAEIGEAIDSTLDSVLPDAVQENVRLRVEPFPRPLNVACAPGVLLSIFSNLIRNALTYIVDGTQPERKVIVRIADQLSVVHVEIEDNGPGIKRENQNRIFQPYFRGSGRGNGLGIGLTTVQRLVEAHGGKVGVRSQLGVGSCFWFELPKTT